MDFATSVMDEKIVNPLLNKKNMEQIALKLGDKNLEQKLELTDNLASALDTNLAVYAAPNPTTLVLTGKTKAIRDKLVDLSDAEAVVTKINTDLAAMETDLDATLTLEAFYIQNTSLGDPAKLALLPVELKGHATNPVTPGAITNFRLSPGVNPGEVIAASDPTTGAMSYEDQMTLDITKPETMTHCSTSSGSRKTIPGFTSGSHVWMQRRAIGGKKAGNGPWCAPSVVTVP